MRYFRWASADHLCSGLPVSAGVPQELLDQSGTSYNYVTKLSSRHSSALIFTTLKWAAPRGDASNTLDMGLKAGASSG